MNGDCRRVGAIELAAGKLAPSIFRRPLAVLPLAVQLQANAPTSEYFYG